ncbi:fungal-specific transcription factor domain-containing protein [Plectosphaerella plurivora]|uniref:Fungal-specific transcription factor domain-containing protein n=1 Tax=Plectosphaerella plurivora TaxID=936078 RepID=A0A9P9AFA0_9PEZI|nr:fungal-specific transcription factor domain-containing protein [Plectosphaerella plurivora]
MDESQFDGSGPDDAPEPSLLNPGGPIRRAQCTSERKIDLIDRRLDGVIRLLEDMKMSWPPAQPTNSLKPTLSKRETSAQPKSISSHSTPASHTQPSSSSLDKVPGKVIEGESSLAAHSVFANEFLQKVVNTESLQEASLELRDTLDSLSHIVTSLKGQTLANEMTYPFAVPTQRPALHSDDLPPVQKAIALIRAAKSRQLAGVAWIYEFLPMKKFPDICLNVYFAEEHTEAEFIIVNAGLYSLAEDYANSVATGDEVEEYREFAKSLRSNLETSLSNLPLHLPATQEMVIALVFGAFHGIGIAKPSLSWVLISKASELAQTLGWHRGTSMKALDQDDAEMRQFVFWSVYFLEKSLSLRLGRASTIADWDIGLPLPVTSQGRENPLLDYFSLWIRASRCQGRIYELLYSTEAIAQPDAVRQSRVATLAAEILLIGKDTKDNDARYEKETEQVVGRDMMDFFIVSDEVLRTSMLTLIYRASPKEAGSATTFSLDCIGAARQTLAKHQECILIMNKTNGQFFSTYINWTLLFAPFVPFIVIFCNVIETQDQMDLARLHEFVTSIQSAPTVSDAAGKMHRLFQVLYSVALRYIEFRVSTPPEGQMQASAEMDTYLAALGLPPQQSQHTGAADFGAAGFGTDPMGDDAMGDVQRTGFPTMWMGNGAQLDDWFYSNQAMMGLMQQSNFDFPNQQGP